MYRPTGAIEALDVPETLHALIAARLDGLSAEERRLVQDAAVLGKTFTRPALAALTGLPEGELEPLLGSLVGKEVLSVQADPRSPEIGQYGFLQDLVRTVAYETLAKRDRKSKHMAVAAYLERAWGEEEEDGRLVAFTSAARLVPDDTNRRQDVYIHDLVTGQTTRVSVSSTGQQANDDQLRGYHLGRRPAGKRYPEKADLGRWSDKKMPA